jgi:acetylornithine/N-succinyldiaminopimelate aminotransferase
MNIKQTEQNYLMHTYKRYDLVVKKAKDKYIWSDKGKKYLDFFSGISVCNLGHANSKVNAAAKKQIDAFVHVSNLYYMAPQVNLAETIIKKSFGKGKVFLANSGAEANEGAIKLARRWGELNPGKQGAKFEIISFENSFHGRTLTTLSCTGQTKFNASYKPMPEKFHYAKFNDIASVKKLINPKTAAVILEVVQGEGGIVIADAKFLKDLRKLCDDNNILLIFDEIQCGMGRTGKLFAWQNYNVKPDIFTLAKAIANGFPLGAVVAGAKVADVFTYGDHGSTFGGNPVSSAAAVEVFKQMTPKFLNTVSANGKYFISKLKLLEKKYSVIKQVRVVGLMAGVELNCSGKDIVNFAFDKGLLINVTQDTVLRFLPPLTVTKKDIDKVIKILESAIKCQTSKK